MLDPLLQAVLFDYPVYEVEGTPTSSVTGISTRIPLPCKRQGDKLEWADINRDLRALQEVEVEMQGKKLYLRTDLRGVCHSVLQAAGVATPPTVRE